MRAAVLRDEEASGLALHRAGKDDRARLGERLDARRDIGRLAEHLAGRIDHDRPGVEPDARNKFGSALACAPGVEFGEGALDCRHRALGVVLLRLRVAKQGQQPVAEPFQHVPAKGGHRSRRRVQVAAHQIAPVFGV